MHTKIFLGILLLISSTPCFAGVTQVGSTGFAVSNTIHTRASPQDSWKALVNDIDQWWHPDHTWSGDSANLYIRPEVGGCFCEHLPANAGGERGGVEHLHIIYLNPGHELRFDGSLGPFQTMAAQGRMIWTIKATDIGSDVTFTYMVHGYLEGGFAEIAPGVDGVIKLQIDRLAQSLEKQ